MEFFQFCPYFSTHLSLRSGNPKPTKNIFFEISKTRAIISQSLNYNVLSLKLWLWQVFENGLFFGQIMPNDSQNHLNN